jgi:hypothetical protein
VILLPLVFPGFVMFSFAGETVPDGDGEQPAAEEGSVPQRQIGRKILRSSNTARWAVISWTVLINYSFLFILLRYVFKFFDKIIRIIKLNNIKMVLK